MWHAGVFHVVVNAGSVVGGGRPQQSEGRGKLKLIMLSVVCVARLVMAAACVTVVCLMVVVWLLCGCCVVVVWFSIKVCVWWQETSDGSL